MGGPPDDKDKKKVGWPLLGIEINPLTRTPTVLPPSCPPYPSYPHPPHP